MISNREALTKDQQAVLDIITNHRGLISIVFDVDWDGGSQGPQIAYDKYIDPEYLDQIADPNKNRPSRSAKFFAEKNIPRPPVLKKIDMTKDKVFEINPGTCRDTKHKGVEFQHTAKTPTSLIPPDPRYMELFQCDYGMGFLWDIDECNTKDGKYVFPVNAGTDNCFWIDLDTDEKIAALRERLKQGLLTTIVGLREQNNKAISEDKPISWNEIVAGLPKGKLHATFATNDIRSARLRALRAMWHAKEKLNLKDDLPVFILQSYYAEDDDEPKKERRPADFRFYSKEEQEADLQAELVEQQAAQATFDMIKNHRALALPIPNDETFNHYLDQLADPNTFRPSLSEAFYKKQGLPSPEVLKKANLETFEVQDEQPGQCRNTKHKDVTFTHTAKTQTVLLPPEPQWMDLGGNDGSIEFGRVSLLFDIETCDLKEGKYIFPQQENIDDCFWLNVDTEEKLAALKKRFENAPVGHLEMLREQNDKAVSEQKKIGPNAIFAGLPKGQVAGIVCEVNRIDLSNCWEHCVKAQKMAAQIKEKLKLEHVPIYIVQPKQNGIEPVFRIYSDLEQFIHAFQMGLKSKMSNENAMKNEAERRQFFNRIFSPVQVQPQPQPKKNEDNIQAGEADENNNLCEGCGDSMCQCCCSNLWSSLFYGIPSILKETVKGISCLLGTDSQEDCIEKKSLLSRKQSGKFFTLPNYQMANKEEIESMRQGLVKKVARFTVTVVHCCHPGI